MKRRRDMFEEAVCIACGDEYDREIGSFQELCLVCLTKSFERRNENVSRQRNELAAILREGQTITLLQTQEERDLFILRLNAIRKVRGIPEVKWSFLLGHDESYNPNDNEEEICPEVDLLKLMRRRRFQQFSRNKT